MTSQSIQTNRWNDYPRLWRIDKMRTKWLWNVHVVYSVCVILVQTSVVQFMFPVSVNAEKKLQPLKWFHHRTPTKLGKEFRSLWLDAMLSPLYPEKCLLGWKRLRGMWICFTLKNQIQFNLNQIRRSIRPRKPQWPNLWHKWKETIQWIKSV